MPTTSIDLFRKTFPEVMRFAYLNTLRRVLEGCHTVLDLGCGPSSPTALLQLEHSVAVDGYAPLIETAKKHGTHHEYYTADIRSVDALFPSRRFDAVVALDVIEHLTKEDGHTLLSAMESLALRRVVLFTPNGFVPQYSHDGDLQEHLSGWTPEEMRAQGYRVYGMLGHKALRGEEHQHKIKPRALSGILSLGSHLLWTKRHPGSAAAILCVKEMR